MKFKLAKPLPLRPCERRAQRHRPLSPMTKPRKDEVLVNEVRNCDAFTWERLKVQTMQIGSHPLRNYRIRGVVVCVVGHEPSLSRSYSFKGCAQFVRDVRVTHNAELSRARRASALERKVRRHRSDPSNPVIMLEFFQVFDNVFTVPASSLGELHAQRATRIDFRLQVVRLRKSEESTNTLLVFKSAPLAKSHFTLARSSSTARK